MAQPMLIGASVSKQRVYCRQSHNICSGVYCARRCLQMNEPRVRVVWCVRCACVLAFDNRTGTRHYGRGSRTRHVEAKEAEGTTPPTPCHRRLPSPIVADARGEHRTRRCARRVSRTHAPTRAAALSVAFAPNFDTTLRICFHIYDQW